MEVLLACVGVPLAVAALSGSKKRKTVKLTCPECKQKFEVPANRGTYNDHCPFCNILLTINTGENKEAAQCEELQVSCCKCNHTFVFIGLPSETQCACPKCRTELTITSRGKAPKKNNKINPCAQIQPEIPVQKPITDKKTTSTKTRKDELDEYKWCDVD